MQRIQSNKDIKWHLSQSLINHSMMVAEFKSKQPFSDKLLSDNVPNQDTAILSQSEIHMKTIMGDYFRPDDMKFNIRSMLRIKNSLSHIDIDRGQQLVDDDKLVTQLLTLIQREKSTSNTLFLYHGCNSTVAFIYFVNTVLYQLLDINKNKTTFRMDADPFDNYQAMASFVEKYSQSVSRINDHDDGYSEVALCANTFLFGSQQDFAEGSLQFFMDNIAIKTIDLQNLFYNVFLPLGINTCDIDNLISLFDDFKQFHGSALYQIQIPKDEVGQYVYPAIKLGSVYNPHQHQNLYETMNAYRMYYGNKDASNCSNVKEDARKFIFDAQYIINLQARLYASPHANFISQIVSYADISQDSLHLVSGMNEVKAKIRSCVIGMLNSILSSNKKHFSILTNESALFRQRAIVRAEHDVPLTEDLSEGEVLAKAILANNEEKVAHLLLANPLLKNVTLTYEKRAYAGDEKSVSIVDMPVIIVILSKSVLPLSMLDKCFGSNWWLTENVYCGVTLAKMYEILKHIKLDERAQFLQLDDVIGKLGSICYVGQILDLVPKDFKLSYLRLHRPKEANFSWMRNVFPYLVVTHCCNGQIQIKSESDANHIPEFIFDNLHLITSGFEVSWFMPYLTPPGRELLLERCSDKLTTPRCFASLVPHIAPENLQAFLKQYHYLLQSAHVIFTVLKKLPSEDKIIFLQTHFTAYNKSADALTYFLRIYSQFTDPVMHSYILSNIKIETANELVTALSDDCDEVRAEDYLHIVQHYRHLITTEEIFLDVKKRMRKGTAAKFTQMHDELLGIESSALSMFMRSLIRR